MLTSIHTNLQYSSRTQQDV